MPMVVVLDWALVIFHRAILLTFYARLYLPVMGYLFLPCSRRVLRDGRQNVISLLPIRAFFLINP